MSKMNFEQREIRRAMTGRKYVSDINHPAEIAVTVFDVRKAGRGLSVLFHIGQTSDYLGLREFLRRYPHMIED
ncbi:hypothetical protein AU509_11995 [Lonsdalea britannica]|uniref:Uncharacterized protein n=1 Tax=Lonsdalea britannica TaxID=1082704 RepID=A0AAD0SHF3_9GAMM|nr:hypothetical protein [Lonsdalea britannica]AXW87797.1 hypothetical protein CKQ53_13005 [Lonsdalea britannica]OSM95922.1 hypothetical protein AU509_11995 [Lonsdalea britannica]